MHYIWRLAGRQELKDAGGAILRGCSHDSCEHLGFAILRGCSHDSCVPQNAFPKVRGYNRALACVRSSYACHPTLCIRYRIHAGAVTTAPFGRWPSVDCLVHDHIFLALQTAFRAQCQRKIWQPSCQLCKMTGRSRLPKSTTTGTSPSHRRHGSGTPRRNNLD